MKRRYKRKKEETSIKVLLHQFQKDNNASKREVRDGGDGEREREKDAQQCMPSQRTGTDTTILVERRGE